jgi:hypothetical protein
LGEPKHKGAFKFFLNISPVLIFPMKIVVFSYEAGFLSPSPSGTMIAAAPEGTPPRRIDD